MCDFCDYVFDYLLLYGNFKGNSKNKQMQDKERDIFKKWQTDERERKYDGNYITRYEDDSINIIAVTGDSFCEGSLRNVHYCPYCGRKLGDKDV